MLDIKYIRNNQKLVEDSAKNKGYDVDIKKLLILDDKRNKLAEKRDKLRSSLKFKGKPSAKDLKKAKTNKENLKNIESDYQKAI